MAALTLGIVCALGVQESARADFITWTYSTSTTTVFNEFGNDGVFPAGTDPSGNAAPSAGIAFSEVGPPVAKSGPANILALGLRSWCYDANTSQSFFFHPLGTGFTLTFHLTDTRSNAMGTLDFLGHFIGSISATKTDALYVLDSPNSQSLFLGANRYTVAIGPYVVPDPPDNLSHNKGLDTGSIGATVNVQPVSQAPAPSTLALACMGLGGLAAADTLRRRWRRPALASL
jgi:hypothetical protein